MVSRRPGRTARAWFVRRHRDRDVARVQTWLADRRRALRGIGPGGGGVDPELSYLGDLFGAAWTARNGVLARALAFSVNRLMPQVAPQVPLAPCENAALLWPLSARERRFAGRSAAGRAAHRVLAGVDTAAFSSWLATSGRRQAGSPGRRASACCADGVWPARAFRPLMNCTAPRRPEGILACTRKPRVSRRLRQATRPYGAGNSSGGGSTRASPVPSGLSSRTSRCGIVRRLPSASKMTDPCPPRPAWQ